MKLDALYRPSAPSIAAVPPRRRSWRRRATSLGLLAVSLKTALPLIALGLIGLLVFWADTNLSEGRFHVGVTELASSAVDKFNLVNARFEGMDSKDRPFSITAIEANEIDSGAGLIALKQLEADITLESGAWLALRADAGMFRRKSDLLELDGSVSLFHDRGYAIEAESLRVDLEQRVAVSHDPIILQGPEGNLTAEGFRLENGGDKVEFFGRSTLVFYSGARVPDLAIE